MEQAQQEIAVAKSDEKKQKYKEKQGDKATEVKEISKISDHSRDLEIIRMEQAEQERKVIKEKNHRKKKDKNKRKDKISRLSDDCLERIFHYLTIAEKIRMERVCKRWQVISQLSWRSFKVMDSNFKTWGMVRYPPKPYHTISLNILEKVVNMCGIYLTSVCLSLQAFRQICKLTVNLRELRLFDILPHLATSSKYVAEYESSHWKGVAYDCHCDVDDWNEIVIWLLDNGRKITTFELSLCHTFYQEEDLSRLFLTMRKLKSFSLTDCSKMNFNGKCLANLPFDTIEEICLVNLQNLENVLLSSMIRKCKKLKKVCLYRLFGEEIDSIIAALALHSETLTNVNLRISGSVGRRIEDLPQILTNMSMFNHLEKLDFVNAPGFVNNDTLSAIAENCPKLVRLNISGESYVTDQGIAHLGKLKKLTYLDIRDIPRLKYPPLHYMENLLVINCANCRNLRDDSVILLFEHAQNLSAINLRKCYSVTRDVVVAAQKITKIRKSEEILHMFIERVKVPKDFYFSKNSSLSITIGNFTGGKHNVGNILYTEENVRLPEIRIYPYPIDILPDHEHELQLSWFREFFLNL